MTELDEPLPTHKTRCFFLHVMKTGGYTLATQLQRQFPAERIYGGYGSGESEFLTSTYLYLNPRPLAQLAGTTVAGFQMFAGHFPFAARSLMGDDVVTLTVFRDPVERVISFLKHAQRNHNEHRDMPLEEIYEDPWYHARFFDNHEVKMFAMTPGQMLCHSSHDGWEDQGWDDDERALLRFWREDPAGLTPDERLRFHHLAVPVISEARGVYRLVGAPNTAEVAVDDDQVRRAIENLERVDVIGIFEDYDGFTRDVSSQLGLDVHSKMRRNVSEYQEVSKDLRTRIASQLGPSLEMYEAARALARARSTQPGRRIL